MNGLNWGPRAEVFPYFVKLESVTPDPKRFDPGYHGTRGPFPVTPFKGPSEAELGVFIAGQQAGQLVGDYSGAHNDRWSYTQFNIKNGARYSAARSYLEPAQDDGLNNLHILTGAFVERIILDVYHRAIGVEFTREGKQYRAFASEEIILSAGAINSPQILMLSGIGPREHLESLGINVVVDSPGVGSNLQDHPGTIVPFTTAPKTGFVYTREEQVDQAVKDYTSKRDGVLASTGWDITAFTRSKYAQDPRPDIILQVLGTNPGGASPARWQGYYYNFKKELIEQYLMPNILRDGFTIEPGVSYPYSRGTVRLASKDPQKQPLIDHNFYSDERDLKIMIEALKITFNITSQPAAKKVDATPYKGKVGDCDKHPRFTDAYLECYAKTITLTNNHPAGTVKMGSPDDPMAPLDPQLRVKGVTGLRVVDASVIPEIVGGHLNGVVVMIAEKASDMIKGRCLKPCVAPFRDEDEVLKYFQCGPKP